MLGCKQCPHTYYVGQTINLRHRIINHFSAIRRNSEKKVHQHFKSTTHTLTDVTLTILAIPDSDKPDILDKLERQWIKRLNTFELGLNSDPGNTGGDVCTFILQHNPTSNRLLQIARDWLTKFKDNNSKKLKKHPINIIKANAKNKNPPHPLSSQCQFVVPELGESYAQRARK